MPALTARDTTIVLKRLERELSGGRRTTTRDALACLLGLHGLRISEVCNLRPCDWNGRELFIRTLKGGPRAWIPVRPKIAIAIEQRVKCHRWLLATRGGGRLDPGNLRRRWRAWLKEWGLTSWRFHDLRHTTAHAIFKRSGGNVFAVQRALRHRKLENTAIYLDGGNQLADWFPQAEPQHPRSRPAGDHGHGPAPPRQRRHRKR
jgi:integrase